MRRDLRRQDLEALAWATLLLPALTLGVHLAGFRRCHRLLRRSLGRRPRCRDEKEALAAGRRLAVMVDLAASRTSLLLADCLPRALSLWWLCRRRRLPAEFKLGVRTITGRFEAHAWVEIAGHPIGEDEAVERVYDAFDLDAPGPARAGT